VRDLFVRQRTQAINALRSHIGELGIVAALPSSPAFESDGREVRSASISARSDCKNGTENVGD